MPQLENGVWTAEPRNPDQITEVITTISPQADRYHLYFSYACPFAHRAVLTIAHLGLNQAVSSSSTTPINTQGWAFDEQFADPLYGVDFLYQLYQKADNSFSGRASVPLFWDKEDQRIASNNSAELAWHLATQWQALAKNQANLVPTEWAAEIKKMNVWLNAKITLKVYQVGQAQTDAEYQNRVQQLFEALAELDARLAKSRYLFGEQITLSDFFLFPSLIRFEAVYADLFKCNLKPLSAFVHLYRYMLDLYQTPHIQNTVDIPHIRQSYYGVAKNELPNVALSWLNNKE